MPAPLAREKRRLLLAAAGAALVAVSVAAAASARGRSGADAGMLALRASFSMVSTAAECPAGAPPSAECFARTGNGVVPGLGHVSESYTFVVETDPGGACVGGVKLLGSAARFTVAGKGEIESALAASAECFSGSAVLTATRPFTVTGGSGAYAGASGSGTLHHDAHLRPIGGAAGTDTWLGTLSVPGLNFDVTAPTLSGAVARAVRAPRGAKRIRVRFKVTARDDVDGPLPVTCRPRSGSRFKLGKTRVTCSATDSSGNTATAKFTLTVRARH